jgi:hypothetical protein
LGSVNSPSLFFSKIALAILGPLPNAFKC